MNDQATPVHHVITADLAAIGVLRPERRAIEPTIGRKVWYRHDGSSFYDAAQGSISPSSMNPSQPMDATVVYVWGPNMVNLLVTDHAGKQFPITSVTLRQPGEAPPSGRYCEWMPYQVARG